ncbi:MAG: hypothetical protein U0U66_04800 [Cytophagaceae bacterium]
MRLKFTYSIFLVGILSVFIISCKTGKQKVPKSKKLGNATINDDRQFYNHEDDAALQEQQDKSKQKRKELEKIHPRELNQDYDVNKAKRKGPPTPQTYY